MKRKYFNIRSESEEDNNQNDGSVLTKVKPKTKKVKKVKNIFPSSLSKYQMFQRNLHEFNKTVKNKQQYK